MLGVEEAAFAKAAQADDAAGFAILTEQYRRELLVHCYRMLASYEDAQDLTQETFLRAWDRRSTFGGRALRAWLYRIATNACLDFLEKRRDRIPVPADIPGETEVRYLQPYPDSMLPAEATISRETVELAFIVAVQHLPALQRAVLILRDVLGWPAQQTAESLETSVASANSALQRARVTMREKLPDDRLDWQHPKARELSNEERTLVDRYVDAHQSLDLDGLAALLRDDVRFAMPPDPGLFIGRDVCMKGWLDGGFGKPPFDEWRAVPTTANLQPAVAMYLRDEGGPGWRAFLIDVLTVKDGLVETITTFEANTFESLGLPMHLDPVPNHS